MKLNKLQREESSAPADDSRGRSGREKEGDKYTEMNVALRKEEEEEFYAKIIHPRGKFASSSATKRKIWFGKCSMTFQKWKYNFSVCSFLRPWPEVSLFATLRSPKKNEMCTGDFSVKWITVGRCHHLNYSNIESRLRLRAGWEEKMERGHRGGGGGRSVSEKHSKGGFNVCSRLTCETSHNLHLLSFPGWNKRAVTEAED